MRNHFDLAALARRRGRRKSARVRPIDPPTVTINNLSRIIRPIVMVWQTSLRTEILPLYEEVVVAARRDSPDDRLKGAVDRGRKAAAAEVQAASDRAQRWTVQAEVWHRYRWAGGVRAALGVDVWPYLDVADVQVEIDAALARNVSLIRGLGDATSKEVEQYVWDALVNHTPRRDLGQLLGERLGVARSRADFIARDQTLKLSGNLDQLRQLQAGIDSYIWQTAEDERVRPTHAERQGKVFRWDDEGIKPREEPNCRCTAQAYVDVEGAGDGSADDGE